MSTGSVFVNNRTQAVRLPADTRFPEGVKQVNVRVVGKAAADYGDIRAVLERKGTLTGVNDLHIAGHARSEGLTLVRNNLKEFERVEALRLENWV